MHTSLPVCDSNPDSVCTAVQAGGCSIDVGSGNGYDTLLPQQLVDTMYVVKDTVQFVFSIGKPTRQLYPNVIADTSDSYSDYYPHSDSDSD